MSALNIAVMGLRNLIASGELKPGDQFPPEPELCERLGVSRGSLREAVRMWSSLGVIESRHGSGTYVSNLAPADLLGSLTLTLGLAPIDTVLDLYEVRRVLEGHAAGMAAAQATAQDIDALQDLVERMAIEDDNAQASILDAEFHDFISGIAGNEALRVLLKVLRSRNPAFHKLYDFPDGLSMRQDSERGHSEILLAIANRDIAAAQTAASHHIWLTEQNLRRFRPEPEVMDLP